ncbi:DUF2971 domain-containing protein [Shewanella rhizosphaerae]|uniref:DUF2971 domain-containing protein n=1 Tax=Shewanella rhizosphaerae TaxID=2864207 RepID=UPI001C65CC0F|nr:DUF2971 domain-containing protein [Shewanella rhizosphaerae]QYK13190.1 DUF2971 domain-containing protein [Shewanella rhizosphaerae]
MLVKYYGLDFDQESKEWLPRVEFISNGLFRMTLPKYLNDKGSEARLSPYFNEFSPADYAWARKEHSKMEVDLSYVPSNEELENFFLKPAGVRYGEQFPHMLRREGFQSIEEYDKENLIKVAQKLNLFLVEALSCQLGVFSLSKSATKELMWTHYASEGKGLAVTFDEQHSFFDQLKPKDVTYTPEQRASLTYYKGMMRINGAPIEHFQPDSFRSSIGVLQSLLSKGINVVEFSDRLLYSKDQQWAYEEESRIVCPLMYCEEKIGKTVQPDFGFQLPEQVSHFFHEYSEVNLKRIPFDAFKTIIFGYGMAQEHKLLIMRLVNENSALSHLELKEAKHDIFGKLEIVDFVV